MSAASQSGAPLGRREQSIDEGEYVEISPHIILPAASGGFSIMLRHGDSLLLYAKRGENFTQAHRERLNTMGVTKLYINASELKLYHDYLQRNLPTLLHDESIPVEARAGLWGQTAANLARDIYEERLSRATAEKRFERVEKLVQTTTQFLYNPEALKRMANYVSRGYTDYHHSLGVMVFSLSVAQTYEEFDDATLTSMGLGAIFHDIGKIRLPQSIFEKKEVDRSSQELSLAESHPSLGVAVVGNLSLDQLTIQSILFHHEQENGHGFPSRVGGEDIPLPVKILSLCNVYENLTRATVEGPAQTPFEALSWLKQNKDRFDLDAMRRLIMVLSKADIT